jgi:hypothetical protein
VSYKKHSMPVDESILERITVEEVEMWLTAKLHSLRVNGLPLSTFEIQAWHRDYRAEQCYDTHWTAHAPGSVCAYGETLDSVCSDIATELKGFPQERAREKRAEARRLLEEAEKLEKVNSETVAKFTRKEAQ